MSMPKYLLENTNDTFRKFTDVVLAHDSVHPDHSVCGGVGGCSLLNVEVELRDDLVQCLEAMIRHGGKPQVTL